MSIPSNAWIWFGEPGHFVAARFCRFHMHTRVGDWRVSTVGDYYPPNIDGTVGNKRDQVGLNRFFETMVFRINGECECGDERCLQGAVDYSGGEMVGAQDDLEAHLNHMNACRRCADGGDS